MGADIGTQGVRVIALRDDGEKAAAHAVGFPIADRPEEQDPDVWWRSLAECARRTAAELRRRDEWSRIGAISVTSTSGTMIALDRYRNPLSPALLYSDTRSAEAAVRCAGAASAETASTGGAFSGTPAFNSSYGLPKIVWFCERYPEAAERIASWAHAADYITGRMCGVWGVTDYTNVLKTGYDLVRCRWPDYIGSRLGIPAAWLPEPVPSGTVIGGLAPEAAEAFGLPPGIPVAVGMTDGCASQIASGAVRKGEWNTTIGTTLVVKGVTAAPIADPLGRLYNHKHPEDGYWMPGGAGNTGGDWVSRDYAGADLDRLGAEAAALVPTGRLAYPLLRTGERFPFVAPDAVGFEPPGMTNVERFAARMEGVAYVERLAYETIRALSGERVDAVYTAGGASNSGLWLRIRSAVLGLPIRKMRHPEGAAGAAVLAASRTGFSGLSEAASAMVRPDRTVEPPSAAVTARYDELYRQFVEELERRGYLKGHGANRTGGTT